MIGKTVPAVVKLCPKCNQQMVFIPKCAKCSECGNSMSSNTDYWLCLKCVIVIPVKGSERND